MEEPMQKFVGAALWALISLSFSVPIAHAHGVIGKRFFPATLVVDDPFVSDEIDLLKVNKGSTNQEGKETSCRQTGSRQEARENGRRLLDNFPQCVVAAPLRRSRGNPLRQQRQGRGEG